MFPVIGLDESALSMNEKELTERRLLRDESGQWGGVGGCTESSASLSSGLQFWGEKLGSISRQFPETPDGPCSP